MWNENASPVWIIWTRQFDQREKKHIDIQMPWNFCILRHETKKKIRTTLRNIKIYNFIIIS